MGICYISGGCMVSGCCILPWCPVKCLFCSWTTKLIDWLNSLPPLLRVIDSNTKFRRHTNFKQAFDCWNFQTLLCSAVIICNLYTFNRALYICMMLLLMMMMNVTGMEQSGRLVTVQTVFTGHRWQSETFLYNIQLHACKIPVLLQRKLNISITWNAFLRQHIKLETFKKWCYYSQY